MTRRLTLVFQDANVDMSQVGALASPRPILSADAVFFIFQIELKAEDLYDKEKVDLETIVIEDVFKLLQCDENGLAPEEAARRLELFGPNKLEQEEQNPILQVSVYPVFKFSLKPYFVSVFEFHVESSVLGHGSCRPRRHCPFEW